MDVHNMFCNVQMLQGRTGRKLSQAQGRGQDNKLPASATITEQSRSSYTSTASSSTMYADYPLYGTGMTSLSLFVSFYLIWLR